MRQISLYQIYYNRFPVEMQFFYSQHIGFIKLVHTKIPDSFHHRGSVVTYFVALG